MERLFAWLSRYRRLNIVYDRAPDLFASHIWIAMISIISRRLVAQGRIRRVRQRHEETGAAVICRSGPDRAAVALGHPFDNGQTQPAARKISTGCSRWKAVNNLSA